MKVQLSPMVQTASGSLGGLTFRETRDGTVVQTRSRPGGSPTSAQIVQRATWSDIVGSYRVFKRAFPALVAFLERQARTEGKTALAKWVSGVSAGIRQPGVEPPLVSRVEPWPFVYGTPPQVGIPLWNWGDYQIRSFKYGVVPVVLLAITGPAFDYEMVYVRFSPHPGLATITVGQFYQNGHNYEFPVLPVDGTTYMWVLFPIRTYGGFAVGPGACVVLTA